MADGGEGTLDVLGGKPRWTTVSGPLGRPVTAEWRLLPSGSAGDGPTAVIEMARAAGRSLLPAPSGQDALAATTAGVGELVLAAADAGARRIVVALGGSATTDGGLGAVEAIGTPRRLGDVELVAACDVRTPFLRAARVFGPQKGAGPEQVEVLERRLAELARRYRADFGVDVTQLDGAGAAGGLAGGLAVLGARLRPGFSLLAELVGLPGRLARADAVMTGEGHLDRSSLDGKVVGSVADTVAGRAPILCVVGAADPDAVALLVDRHPLCEVVSLTSVVGAQRASSDTVASVAQVVGGYLTRHRASG